MVLLERMVLLLIEMAPNNCVEPANILLVINRLSKRYSLQMGNGLNRLDSLRGSLLIQQGAYGLRLTDGGSFELEKIHRKQRAFCSKFREAAEPLLKNSLSTRSQKHASLRSDLHEPLVPAQIRNHCEARCARSLPPMWPAGQAGNHHGQSAAAL